MRDVMHSMVMLILGVSLGFATSADAATPVSNSNQLSSPPVNAADGTRNDEEASPPNRTQRKVQIHRLPWSQLSPDQRHVLAPLRDQWNRMPAKRQQHLATRAQDWAQLPPQRRAVVSDRIQRWARMDQEQRQQAMRGADQFRDLPEVDRKRLMETWQRFQSLPPEQRRELMQRWREERKNHAPNDRRQPDRVDATNLPNANR